MTFRIKLKQADYKLKTSTFYASCRLKYSPTINKNYNRFLLINGHFIDNTKLARAIRTVLDAFAILLGILVDAN